MSGVSSMTSSAYSVYPTYPPLSLLGFNPWKNPQAVTPPPADHTLTHPFNISPDVYESLLHPAVPIAVAAFYAVIVYRINKLNKDRDYKPWVNTEDGIFYYLVLAHNVLLAIYSGWTFYGMYNTIAPSWPGWDGEHGLAGVADALCKINGPRGLGSAATYDMATTSWGFTDRSMKLLGGAPDSSDVGRIWNEGLAYYGFLFYLSKLYEVFDTAIILAKGKTSSGLQSFHHAGAMICVWAGIRYMSPPIWMFTFINAGIHTLMYTYYALAPIVRIPPQLKRTLTTLQIVQIVFGTSYALLHLFIAYDVPASTPYVFSKNLSSALPSVSKTISSAATSLATSIDYAAWLKKAALRAAGEEGLAENVRNYQGETFGIDAVHAAEVEKAQEEIRYRLTTEKVHCLDTSGQVFAILLNAVYLIPLAYLFCEFFYKTYIGKAKSEDSATEKTDEPIPSTPENIKKSAQEAVNHVAAKIKQAIEDTQGGVTEPPPDVKAQLDDLHTKYKQIAKNADEAVRDRSVKAKEEFQEDIAKMQERFRVLRDKGKDVGKNAINKIKDLAADATENAKKGASKAQQGAQDLGKKAKESAGPALDTAASTADNVKQAAKDGYKKAKGDASQNGQAVKEEAKDAADETDKKAEDVSETAKDATDDAKKSAEDVGDKTKEESEETAGKATEDVKDSAEKASEETKEKSEDTAGKATEDVKDSAKKASNESKEKSEETAGKVTEDVKDSANEASEETKKSAEDASAAGEDAKKELATKAEEIDQTNETDEKDKAQSNGAEPKDKEQSDEKKEDSANSLAPSASTEDERSIRSAGTSDSRTSTPSGTPDKPKKKDKKDKKDGKK